MWAHVTQLEGFSALREGRVEVILSAGPERPQARAEVKEPSRPGIFKPELVPLAAGKHRLSLTVTLGERREVHDLGEVEVYATLDAVPRAPEEEDDGGRIPFLKEQQWVTPFGTAAAERRSLRPSISAWGKLKARADGQALVSAPMGGRLELIDGRAPKLGQRVQAGEVLARLWAKPSEGDDAPSLTLAVEKARIELGHAQHERVRVEGAHKEGVATERELDAAQEFERQAQADLRAAQQRMAQWQQAHGGGSGALELRAPLSGVLTEARVTPGAFAQEGEALLRIVDLERLWLEVQVPAAQVGAVHKPSGAWFEVESFERPWEVSGEALVAAGAEVDEATRTIPFIFEVANPQGALKAGLLAEVHLLTDAPREVLAIPASALVQDGGAPAVFVQAEGESFERRTVQVGLRDGAWVEILSGLAPGERVVSKGAWSVKLASSGSAIPAHGHAH
jgi:RND family efflux transporter MFP subunit